MRKATWKKILFAALMLAVLTACACAAAEEVHVWGDFVKTQDATCRQQEIWTATCTICGATKNEFRGSFADHSWNYSNPDIEFVGCEQQQNVYYYCTVCGHKSNVMNTLPAPGHKYGDFSVTKPATCVAEGTMTQTCSVCGKKNDLPIPATGNHNYVELQRTQPTCLTPGTIYQACTMCGDQKTVPIPATGHTWGSWTTTTAATCSTAGERKRVCTKDASHVETESIPALGQSSTTGHSFGAWTETVPASCTSTGLQTRTCTACGRQETQQIPALGHAWRGWQVVTPPSCNQTGLERNECTRCNETQERTIAMTAHSWTNWTVRVPGTCQDTGTEERTCRNCGLVEQRYTPVGSHVWNPWVMDKEPTCTEPGSRYRVCSICNTREIEVIPALGHVWTDWITVIEPTDDATGIEQHMCPVCGTVETRQLGVVGGNSTMCAFGPRLVDMGDNLAPTSNKWYMFTPFDVSMSGTQTYELVVDNKYIVGNLTVTVHNGNITVNYRVDSPYLRVDLEFFTILDSISLLNGYEPEDLVAEYGLQPGRTYSMAQLNIPYDSELVLYFCSRVTYTYDPATMSALNYGSSIHQAQLGAMLAIMD